MRRRLGKSVVKEFLEITDFNPVSGNVGAFVQKYMPESYALYQKLVTIRCELYKEVVEMDSEMRILDIVRFESPVAVAHEKLNQISRILNEIGCAWQNIQIAHQTMEKSTADVSKDDSQCANKLKTLEKQLPGYAQRKLFGDVVDKDNFVSICGNSYTIESETRNGGMISRKGKDFYIRKTEVTQLEWMRVMGNNPSRFRSANSPVDNVSVADCNKFIAKLNSMSETKRAGLKYRLPTVKEWSVACLAGSTGQYGRRSNGQEGPAEIMGWFSDNAVIQKGDVVANARSGRMSFAARQKAEQVRSKAWSMLTTHNVALKEPNAWGCSDMHGNVWEWCNETHRYYPREYIAKGGSVGGNDGRCIAEARGKIDDVKVFAGGGGPYPVGFRLVAEKVR